LGSIGRDKSDGEYYLYDQTGTQIVQNVFDNTPGMLPLTGDWNGDGANALGSWLLRKVSPPSTATRTTSWHPPMLSSILASPAAFAVTI